MGYIKATYNLGIFYSNKRTSKFNPKKAYKIFLELAKQGYAPAQNRVAMFHTFGFGVEVDYKKAIKWYEKSAKQGYINAQCGLAGMYAAGMGVFPNFGRANAFAKKGYKMKNPICVDVWNNYHLERYDQDKGFKFNFYNKP
jgi:TPR repeat protein